MNGQENVFTALVDFLEKLRVASIYFTLGASRPRMITVYINVPGERWEVEFGEDGEIEVEVFVSRRGVEGQEALEELFQRFSD
jgi:hypothetical protein